MLLIERQFSSVHDINAIFEQITELDIHFANKLEEELLINRQTTAMHADPFSLERSPFPTKILQSNAVKKCKPRLAQPVNP